MRIVETNWDEIDSLLDAGFPANTDLDLENTTYDRSQYWVANANGIDFEIANRVIEYRMKQETHNELFNRFSDETRNYAASSLVDALLASCESQEERIELSVNLLGYDPR